MGGGGGCSCTPPSHTPKPSCTQAESRCANLSRPAAAPVELSLFYESLCPACRWFLVQQLFTAWLLLPSEALSITLVPYGNAQVRAGQTRCRRHVTPAPPAPLRPVGPAGEERQREVAIPVPARTGGVFGQHDRGDGDGDGPHPHGVGMGGVRWPLTAHPVPVDLPDA